MTRRHPDESVLLRLNTPAGLLLLAIGHGRAPARTPTRTRGPGFALLLVVFLAGFAPLLLRAQGTYQDFRDPPHRYFERTPTDRFTRLRPLLESGQAPLDTSNERDFLLSLLRLLDIPASSQMLVFSTTSLQLSRIHPNNPRALYFSDDLYLGYIPGGRIELAAVDPDLGAVFYIFDIPREPGPLRIERADRCMNCHAGEDTGFVPGLVVKSVVPGPTGGTLDAFRRELSGHAIPLDQRFGGWYLTGAGSFTNHWGNAIGRITNGQLTRIPTPPTDRIRPDRYPRPSSDLLPQLLHEHQVGFVNRAAEATYRARSNLANDGAALSPEHRMELEDQAASLVRYLLFVDEAPLPPDGVEADPDFLREFSRDPHSVEGLSLRQLDLRTRLLRHRCSYMIHSTAFAGLPPAVKQPALRLLQSALDPSSESPLSAHLPPEERRAIVTILSATVFKESSRRP